ncbi:MAG: alanine--tRNA ligase [Candidatus Gracilibacteria bacterium]
MTGNNLRQLYLDFFKSKGHAILPSASLIPENDPSVLFTTAGMHPLVPYLMGEKHPEGVRLANSQKCIRTGDIDEVGDNRHLTFFEMLGNWSLGDYFKKEAIAWSWEFLTGADWLALDPNRLYVTVFMGNEASPIDDESIRAWQEQFKSAGINAQLCSFGTPVNGNQNYRIFPLPAKDNWWGPAGATGPCGPCTEMFYDVAPERGSLTATFEEEVDGFRIMEIWNDVFMEFNKVADGNFEKMPAQNVDTGMGLERTLTVITGKQNTFDTEFFTPLFKKIEELSGKRYGENEETNRAMRIVADHLKAATFIMGDDKSVTPSNTDQGYVVRRLIRRAVRYGKQLGITKPLWTAEISEVVLSIYGDIHPELIRNKEKIMKELTAEEEKFSQTLERGLKEFERSVSIDGITGAEAFNLYQTYGFPLEITLELAKEKGITVDEEGFKMELTKHQELSRTASAGKFKGGLADAGEETKKLHTASHLMLAAMRQILGDHVHQKGSNITPERLRFDFSHSEKVTTEQLKKIEKIVNEIIAADAAVNFQEMSLEEAKKTGAEGVFESKYGEKVKVYTVGRPGSSEPPYSREICGGPHVEHTGVLGHFKIQKEESSSAGVRRIKAILE